LYFDYTVLVNQRLLFAIHQVLTPISSKSFPNAFTWLNEIGVACIFNKLL
jgi:hypothetical protein